MFILGCSNGQVPAALNRARGFQPGDVVDLTAFSLRQFRAVQAIAATVGGHVQLNFGGGNTLDLFGKTLAAFTAADVVL